MMVLSKTELIKVVKSKRPKQTKRYILLSSLKYKNLTMKKSMINLPIFRRTNSEK